MKLTDVQIKAANHFKGPALVLAVPGAGKTTILLNRIDRLVSRGVDPRKILSITFSKNAAMEMENRFKRNFNSDYPPVFSTIHSFAFSILRDYGREFNKTYNLVEGNKKFNKYLVLRNLYRDLGNGYLTDDRLETLVGEIGLCKNLLLTPEDFGKERSVFRKFPEIYHGYEKIKAKGNFFDFDDMILLALDILKSNSSIRTKYRNYFDFIQLDEGQDTSVAQFALIKYMLKKENNIFIVADDDQSIYGFRGADPSELLGLKNTFKDLSIYYMEENFRSDGYIVQAAKGFIGKNKSRYEKNLFTENPKEKQVKLVKYVDRSYQCSYIHKNLTEGTNAVLYRNNISALPLIEYFERKSIEFSIRDTSIKFISHFVVRDILNIMEFSKDTGNIELYSEIYYKMKGFISKAHIGFIKKNSPCTDVFKTLLQYPELSSFYYRNILELYHDFKKLKGLKTIDALNFIVDGLNYGEYLAHTADRLGYSRYSLEQYVHILKEVGKNEPDWNLFIGRLKYLEDLIKRQSGSRANLKLSTIHGVKGLEFDNVFLVDLIEENLPSSGSIEAYRKGNNTLLEEERRLLYVAMTRAKKGLYFFIPGEKSEDIPSRFVGEIFKGV